MNKKFKIMLYVVIYFFVGLIYAQIVWTIEREERESMNLSEKFKTFWHLELIFLWPIELGYEIIKKVTEKLLEKEKRD